MKKTHIILLPQMLEYHSPFLQAAFEGCDCITGDGCLVSHICERGILDRLRSLYPHANIQTIEYDYDSSDTLRESRIQMALGDFS